MKPQKSLPAFSQYLKQCRLSAGYSSLSTAIKLANSQSRSKALKLSKAKLSLYERGQVDTLKPEVLRLLATTYKVSYREMAQRWFSERYCISENVNEPMTVSLPDAGYLEVAISDQQITLISLGALEKIQSQVTKGTHILVSAPRFLDDTVFFEMVLANIKRGVTYYYLLPESQRITYRHLISRLERALPSKDAQIDGVKTIFIPRSDFDSPINQVVFLLPNGEVKGYIGYLKDESPLCYQVVEARMALRLFHSFLWMMRVGSDKSTIKAIKELEVPYTSKAATSGERPLDLIREFLPSIR